MREKVDFISFKPWCVLHRLQNSPYFCVFKYVWAVKQRTRLKTESETGEILQKYFFLTLHTRKTLTPRFTDFFTDFEKTDCFEVCFTLPQETLIFSSQKIKLTSVLKDELLSDLYKKKN